jgi:hypothetical protein
MMREIHCENCGNSTIEFESVIVDVKFKKQTFCDHCYQTHSQEQYHFFCSEKCFKEYMTKMIDEKIEFGWETHR